VTSRKSHNSILFLTTLGVYLGLVLVGGTAPATLAHSATTRNFDIADEVEVKDDLDNKPDDERTPLSDSFGVYLQDVEIFLGNLRRLGSGGGFDAKKDAFEVAQSTLLPCVPANKVGSYTADSFVVSNEALRPALGWFSKRLTDGYSLADCLPNERFNGGEATASRFTLKFDRAAFSVEVEVKKQSRTEANRLFAELLRTYKLAAPGEKGTVRRQIYDSTSFKTSNDQVFIVTRLPRGSIDSLVAANAK
jgi:hypothetical protein